MITPETLAAAARVAQHGARHAMLAARSEPARTDEDDRDEPVDAGHRVAAQPFGSGLDGTGPAPPRE